ncbi:CNT family concentrative nucleoside transporter [Roseivirga ehrenbergii]|uniref:Na+ dependent nucleoside transporter domain-containing protein n=1 Tax=Roseivirga ehrenbergii (strain DSM 102268 / JCM 13514 / KCTC 12282 / NCIMB 14502 / KMM 6017) TaxID=279360 RepID=A0A150WYV7_ROSEK|nr:nucleoside transporter C-terminal domain-containing protein [Roseivirga ehrenbergii]KYG71606.1 Na+ dependent nucleoside transporter domain-containing protein [Roseivirga ehrenbergii]TCL07705.1 CNT family concentrative nucleoside transporter [Roseivirga ehrenbergii]
MAIVRGIIGLIVLIGIAYLLSSRRKKVDWRLVGVGVVIQLVIALLISEVGFIQLAFDKVSQAFVTFLGFSLNGAEFLYGDLAKNSSAAEGVNHSLGFLFVFQALPTVIFFSAVTAGLYYLGILQKIVYGFAWIMAKTMRLSGAESMSAAGNIFLGQTEAPLLVKPFIGKMTNSELLCLMTGGMATIAGSVLGAYVSFLGGGDPAQQAKFATYLLSASIMNAPAAIVMSKIFLPELEPEKIDSRLKVNKDQIGVNVIDALAGGASDGMKLAMNIAAMLLAFIAVIYSLNWVLVDGIGAWTGLNTYVVSSTNGVFSGFSLEYILGQVFRVFAFIMGVEWSETLQVGSLIGQKTVINEFVAYLSLADMKAAGDLSEKSIIIATYALCGFANFSSIAIQIGGIGGLAPNRQGDLSRLGIKALMAATLATMMTATIAGALFG